MGRKIVYGLCVAAALACAASVVSAQPFPTKPVRFIVPFAPGGGNDIIARVLGQKLSEGWGQQVVVDNRPGAGGNVAAETTARAAPDGHTIFQFNVANAIAPSVYRKIAYDPVKDFAAVTQLATSPFIMVVTASLRASSVKEFIALAKAPQSRVNYASSGNGGSTHLLTELFKTMAGIDITHVPYNGAAPALNDLIGGQVQMLLAVPATAIPHMKSGRLRALAVSSVRRSPLVPELPTIAEAGVPGFEGATWYGVVAPARTPPAVVTQLNRDFLSALRTPDVRDRLVSQGVEIVGSTPDEFAQFVRNEIPKWAKAAQISGARVE